ncbi:MAG: SDR family oxidoreductase, partial [Acidimicrobiia bacterium]
MVLLEGKRVLVTGVLNEQSIAFAVARNAQEQGAEVVLSSFGRVMRITEKVAKRLPDPDVKLVELDVTSEENLAALAGAVGGQLDGVVHSLAFAPASCLGGGFLDAPWEDVATAVQVSAYSLKSLTTAALPLMSSGGSIVGLDFDNDNTAWPFYDWMGVSKAALESVSRYLARDLGP